MQATITSRCVRARIFLFRGAYLFRCGSSCGSTAVNLRPILRKSLTPSQTHLVDISSNRIYQRRGILEVSRIAPCFYNHLNGFLSDNRRPPERPGWMLNGYAGLSSLTGSDGKGSKQSAKQEPKAAVVRGAASAEQVPDTKILRTLMKYMWLKDNLEFRVRVFAAMGFLVGAKVLNVQVPFLFKLAVDWLTTATGNAGALASFTAANSTALALFWSPVAVLIGYGIARAGAAAFNGFLTFARARP